MTHQAVFMRRSLCIIPGFRCQLACPHCISGSSPADDRELTEREMTALCGSLEERFVETLSFSGGEPVLYLDKVVRLGRSATKINPNVSIRLTTNARFASSLDACNKVFVQISNLSSIRISYDDLHSSENGLASVATIVRWAAQADVRCSINVSAVHPLDLVVLRSLPSLGVPINVAKVAPFGRASRIASNLAWQEDVRTIRDKMSTKCNSLAKAVYFPGRGWTFCCSEVAFNHSKLDSLFFSSSLEDLGLVPALKKMQELTFNELFELTPHFEEKPVHECQICAAYWEGTATGESSGRLGNAAGLNTRRQTTHAQF